MQDFSLDLVLLFLGVQSEFFCNCLAGPRFNDAFQDPGEYLAIEPLFEVISFLGRNKFQGNCSHGLSSFFFLISSVSLVCIHYVLLIGDKERYIVTYNPSKVKVYALLKDQAKSDDILKAAFHVRFLTHLCLYWLH